MVGAEVRKVDKGQILTRLVIEVLKDFGSDVSC
jgi:hypothetical protein